MPVVYDAEALYFRRIERQAELAAGEVRQLARRGGGDARARGAIAAEVDAVVCIAEEEAELLAGQTKRPGPRERPVAHAGLVDTRAFAARSDVGFIAGWAAGRGHRTSTGCDGSPATCGLAYWPGALSRACSSPAMAPPRGSAIRMRLDPVPRPRSGPQRVLRRLRVAMVPIRYGSGVKLKAVEALQFGVPTVSTTIGAESIPSDVDGLLPVADDPDSFAARVAEVTYGPECLG